MLTSWDPPSLWAQEWCVPLSSVGTIPALGEPVGWGCEAGGSPRIRPWRSTGYTWSAPSRPALPVPGMARVPQETSVGQSGRPQVQCEAQGHNRGDLRGWRPGSSTPRDCKLLEGWDIRGGFVFCAVPDLEPCTGQACEHLCIRVWAFQSVCVALFWSSADQGGTCLSS